MNHLTREELVNMIKSVFPKRPQDKALGVLTDIPNAAESDTANWRERRRLAWAWRNELEQGLEALGLRAVHFIAYASVDSNNADLPEYGFIVDHAPPDVSAELEGEKKPFAEIFAEHQLFLAPTQFSTTAPLKVAAKKYGFRAATMPGFSPKMIPALRIDYNVVNERCLRLKTLLDEAQAANVEFLVNKRERRQVYFDLRYREAHASSGRFPEPGTAGNLPSGETYIVPYEGEQGEPSKTNGVLPVQFGDEIVLFRIENNRAVAVLSEGKESEKQAAWLAKEPAYGNMAELGFGILSDFGLQPIDEILLDEKLAFHIAFGRSDHFGGDTGPDKFSSPAAVVHIDRIYSPMMQSKINIAAIDLTDAAGRSKRIMENDGYCYEDEDK